jgi:hypothetical protein
MQFWCAVIKELRLTYSCFDTVLDARVEHNEQLLKGVIALYTHACVLSVIIKLEGQLTLKIRCNSVNAYFIDCQIKSTHESDENTFSLLDLSQTILPAPGVEGS